MSKMIETVLACYNLEGAKITPITIGHINTTFLVEHIESKYILQKLNPIFSPLVHNDIEAVTKRLGEGGLLTPRLYKNKYGQMWTEMSEQEIWRLQSFMPGEICKKNFSLEKCASAGRLLGHFHKALTDFNYHFQAKRPNVHNRVFHIERLKKALEDYRQHIDFEKIALVGESILEAESKCLILPTLPDRIVHGDPKIDNILFSAQEEALCLIDLDTVSRLNIPVELGDAFRSWSNVQGESCENAIFSLSYFEGGFKGYMETATGLLKKEELYYLAHAIAFIPLELAARFCTDALEEKYFAWDKNKYSRASEHNLQRAKSQLHLAQSVQKQFGDIQKIIVQHAL